VKWKLFPVISAQPVLAVASEVAEVKLLTLLDELSRQKAEGKGPQGTGIGLPVQ
jgi:hypothetical protein